ncbi:MAG: hypothetical protein V9G29_15720 [Burkholderiaceae bacterium]
MSNMIGPVIAGTVIDAGGFGSAFLALCRRCPMISLWWMRRVPVESTADRPEPRPASSAWDLLRSPGLRLAADGELAALVELGSALPSWCPCSDTSAGSARRRSA